MVNFTVEKNKDYILYKAFNAEGQIVKKYRLGKEQIKMIPPARGFRKGILIAQGSTTNSSDKD